MTRLLPLCAGAVVAALSLPSLSQPSDDEKYIGIGVRIRPAYDGADSSRVEAIPYLRLYGEHIFARTTQGLLEGGWRTRPFGGWVFGAQLAYEEGRIADDSAFLKDHGFEDLDPSASLGVHAEGDWKIGRMPLNALLRLRHDLNSNNGTQADVRGTAGILEYGRFRAGLFGQLTWGDEKSTQRYFGITQQQSAASGLPVYNAGSGLRYAQAGLLGDVNLCPHLIGLWSINLQQMLDDTRDSPIVRDKTTWSANAGVAYRF
jgi:outer membrane protein